jgi:hypothetical protein
MECLLATNAHRLIQTANTWANHTTIAMTRRTNRLPAAASGGKHWFVAEHFWRPVTNRVIARWSFHKDQEVGLATTFFET